MWATAKARSSAKVVRASSPGNCHRHRTAFADKKAMRSCSRCRQRAAITGVAGPGAAANSV
jgi:hypothetical protein